MTNLIRGDAAALLCAIAGAFGSGSGNDLVDRCNTAGDSVAFGEVVQRSGDHVTRSMGTRTCDGSTWGTWKITYDEHVVDSGELALPATALLGRATSLTLAAPDSTAIFDVISTTETTA
jgi:hypothetical protein